MSTRGWKREEVEKLVDWIAENQPITRGFIAAWAKRAKEEVFPENDNIDVKKIKSKFYNMRYSYKAAKAFLGKPGYGVPREDGGNAHYKALEKKCAFFWRLHKIWGSERTSTTPIALCEAYFPSRNNTQASSRSNAHKCGKDMSKAREGGDSSEQSTSGVHQIQTSRNSTAATSRKRKAFTLRDLFELNRKHRNERHEIRAKIEVETRSEIARTHADSMRHIDELNRRFLAQQKQLDKERENEEHQMTMLRMVLEALKDQPGISRGQFTLIAWLITEIWLRRN